MTEDKAWAGALSNGIATTAFGAPKILDEKVLTDQEFKQCCELFFYLSGIKLTANKKHLVAGRLGCRLRHYGLANFTDYFKLATRVGNEAEKQRLLDLLTTNETYFFREPCISSFCEQRFCQTIPENTR